MSDPLAISFRPQLEDLRTALAQGWAWPSPGAGFALHVFAAAGDIPAFSPGPLTVLEGDRRRLDQAPVLAAVGYVLSYAPEVRSTPVLAGWGEGFDRLSSRNAFPTDRESFAFRPVELLGIVLGALQCPGVSTATMKWLKNVLLMAEQKCDGYDVWQRLLSACAAHLVGQGWRPAPHPPLEFMGERDLALIYWLGIAYPEFAADQELAATGLDLPLATRCATLMTVPADPAPAAVLLFSLTRAVGHLVASGGGSMGSSAGVTSTPAPPATLKGKIDFAVITVREDEHRAVLARFPKDYLFRGRHRTYSVGRLAPAGGGAYRVAVVKSIEQGEGSGQDVARDVIEDLDPQWILLVGIAGGVPANEYTLGDVVTALRLHDFSVKALLDGRDPQYAVTGAPSHKVVQDRLASLGALEAELAGWNTEASIGMARPPVDLRPANFYGGAAWKRMAKEALKRHFGPAASARRPLVTAGSMASSDSLVKDTGALAQWQESARQILAVEMELGGVYHAAHRAQGAYPVLAIRGISDVVGFKRHADWTAYSCNTAAAFARAFLLTRPIEPRDASVE